MVTAKLTYITSIFLICVTTAMHAQVPYPELTFKYDWRGKCIDFIGCLFFQNTLGFKKISAVEKEQFQTKLPALIAYWHQQAPILFGEIIAVFNRGFKQKQRTVIICLGGSWSYGSRNLLLLGLHYYLDSEQWTTKISQKDSFTNLIFHELLHIWVDDNVGGKSALLKKYHDEHEHVRDHLHLMALQKMVYIQLNRSDMVEELDISYRTQCLPEYRRAWEIVEDIEGYEAVVQDIIDAVTK